ncbi:MAG TPA: hypothetical protein VJS66_00720 [Burkholderiales bacterium]|nr:hypothetical protein [Burkholderiales bacterium]
MKQLACALLLTMTTPALAVIPMTAETERSFDFALSAGKTETEFTYTGAAIVDTTVEFVELSWYERIYAGVDIGLHLGKTFLSQTNRAATAGLDPNGTHIGVGVRALFLGTSPIQPFVHALYYYRRVEETDGSDSVTLAWHEPRLRLGITMAPWGPLRVYAGADWSAVDGSERVSGTMSSTTDFERDGSVSGFLGLDFTIDATGFIGVEAHTGDAGNGVGIYFKRRY